MIDFITILTLSLEGNYKFLLLNLESISVRKTSEDSTEISVIILNKHWFESYLNNWIFVQLHNLDKYAVTTSPKNYMVKRRHVKQPWLPYTVDYRRHFRNFFL